MSPTTPGLRQQLTHRSTVLTLALGLVCALLWLGFPTQARGQKTDEVSLYSVAVQAYQDGLLDLARDQLQGYLAAYPHGKYIAEVNYLLGDFFFRKGDFAQATAYLREALQHPLPEGPRDDGRLLLGRSYLETGQSTEAVQALQPLIAPGTDGRWRAAALYWTGEALLGKGEFSAAAAPLQELVQNYPSSEYLEEALYALGYARQKANAHEQGLATFQQFLQRFPESHLRRAAELGVARALVALQRFADAAPHWQALRDSAAGTAQAEDAAFWWAESWHRAERCDQAKPAFEEYLHRFSQGSHRAEALIALAGCAQTAGDGAAEISALDTFMQQFPHDPRRDVVLLHLAEAYERAARLEQARAAYSQWLTAFPDHPRRAEVLIRRGLISRQQQDYAHAAEDLTAVLAQVSDPQQQMLAHTVLAESYVMLDDCAAAQPHLAFVIAQAEPPAQRQAHWQRGVCAFRNKAFATAVEEFSLLADDAAFTDERSNLLLLLGQSLAALHRDVEAIPQFRQSLADAPTDQTTAQALAGLGASLLKTGQVDEALPVYEQLLTVAPELPGRERLQLQLGLLYLERQEVDGAKPHLNAAASGSDEAIAAEATYRLADVQFAAGHTTEATTLLQRLTRRFPSQPGWVGIASYRLALLYEAAERWPDAWQAYQTAADTATDAKLVVAARERAQHLEETVDVHARRQPAETPAERP